MAIGRYPSRGTIATSCTYSAACGHQQGKWPQRAPFGNGAHPGPPASDRVRYIYEDVAHAEAGREQVAETAHAEGLGGVVAGGEEVHAGLPGAGHRALDRLAGDERVEAGGDRVLEVVGARAGDDADGPHAVRAVREGERLAVGRRAHAGDELAGRDAVARKPPDDADRGVLVMGERLPRLAPDRFGEQRVVAVLGMAVERQVVGGEAHVGVE